MLLRDNELARRQENQVALREAPIRVRWAFADALTRDGLSLKVIFTCSIRVLEDPAERRMFEEVLLGPRYALTDDDLSRHFAPSLQRAVEKAALNRTAAEWLGDEYRGEMIEAVRLAAAPVAFGCGVEMLSPFHLETDSPEYHRQRARSLQQDLAERQAAGQLQHVQRAAELFKSFQSIRDAAPDLSPGRVLQQINPADQGSVLQTLLLASAKQRQAELLWAVAGPYIIRIDARGEPANPERLPLPPSLGPLRSVAAADVEGRRTLLVGARTGFMQVDPKNPAGPEMYSLPGVDSPLGFNRVQYWPSRKGFVASHGDGGIAFWPVGSFEKPQTLVRPDRFLPRPEMVTSESGSVHTGGPRNLQVLDDRTLVFSAAGRLFLTDLAAAQPVDAQSASEIVAIVPEDQRVIVVHEDGTLSALDRATRQMRCIGRRGTHVRSAGALPWLGANRLLLAGDQGVIQCVGLDDPLVTEYASPHRGMRVVAGSSDLVAAVSGDRQRVLLWQTWDGREPLTELYLTGMTRHRVADVAFA